jgi:hypothetical protein
MSIFWRSAVYDWKTSTGQKSPTVDLGAYEEPIRKFLLGNAPFPDDVVLAIDIWPYKDVLPLLHPVVTEQLSQGVRRYWFYVPGLHFFLFNGANIPKDARESAAKSSLSKESKLRTSARRSTPCSKRLLQSEHPRSEAAATLTAEPKSKSSRKRTAA